MTRIPGDIRDIIEMGIYLPMTITVLNRDLEVISKSPFKLKQPYLSLVENSLKQAQRDLSEVRQKLRKEHIKISELKRDEAFTLYSFHYKGYEEQHNYFNPRIRNKVSELLEDYLLQKRNI
ncbi:hypothetical protein GJU40_15410 [Bacillus lacus]|uniref:YhjD n=1 Tax=Metabacillus lacus TaxID=1983721 RepID=A0A7X2J153_9BACI|nr:hypothetical protein [Metabacillus lacus]MRX73531.1 hypothetical protein [Metabacillus lacus]